MQAIPRPRSPLAALVATAAAVVLVAWAVVVAVVHHADRLVGGTTGLRWSDGLGTWQAVDPSEAERRLWGPTDAFLTPAFETFAPGFSVATLAFGRGVAPLTVDVVVVRIDPHAWRFRVWGRADWRPDRVDTLAAEAHLPFAVNAAYFADSGPLGLIISDGVRRNAQGTRRAAHFLVFPDGPHVVNERRTGLAGATEGFQGFPAVMSGGRTYSYMRDGGRGFDVRTEARRTAACTTRTNDVLIVVTDTTLGGLTLDELATVLGGLGCVDAMGFDGGSSTGLSLHVGEADLVVENPTDVPVIVGAVPR